MKEYELFNNDTQAIIYGFQANAVQRMLDFDYVCQREKPSVAAIIRPTQEAAMNYHKVLYHKYLLVMHSLTLLDKLHCLKQYSYFL